MSIVDLSHTLEPGMPSYPGLPEPQFAVLLSRAESAPHYDNATFEIATYAFGGNTGTYVDAPFHRHADGPDLAGLALERLADLPGIVIDAPEAPIGPDVFAGRELAGKAVLVRTDWSRHWGTNAYFRSGPFLTEQACRFLVEQHVALVGVDFANVDDMNGKQRPAHTLLLGAGIPLVEHLAHLDQLPNQSFRFFAVPPAVVGGTSFPVRAFALLT